jgi:hypothetical protein
MRVAPSTDSDMARTMSAKTSGWRRWRAARSTQLQKSFFSWFVAVLMCLSVVWLWLKFCPPF